MNSNNTSNSIYDIVIRLAFLAFIVAWCLMILLPFVSIMLWSIILALAFAPLHRNLVRLMRGKPRIASAIIVLLCLAVIVVPLWFFMDSLIREALQLKDSFIGGNLVIPPPPETVKTWPIIGNPLYDLWHSASVDLQGTIIKYKDQLTGVGATVGKGILSATAGLVQLLVSLLIAAVLLAVPGTGDAVRKFFRRLAGERGDEFADVTVKTVGKVVKGVIGVALIQATLIGIGFLLAGIPYSGIWTLMVFILAVLQLPVILVVIPVAIFMFFQKSLVAAILWTIYLLLAGASENIFKPLLLGKGAPVPMLVIFIGVIGGFIFSGFIGLFTGAIIMSIGYKLFQAWLNEGEPSLP